MCTDFNKSAVGGYKELQNSKLKGVKNTQSKVDIAVSETDKPRSAFAKELMKFETVPPGQAATKNIPSAKPGSGFQSHTIQNVTNGNRTNWASSPSKVGLGRLNALATSDHVSSRETPNMMNPRMKFKANLLLGSKFI